MPRFSDKEKEIIRQRLLDEGTRLFTAFGLKKVSVDELVQAAGIAKGSFYAFFQSKEHLFMEIIFNQQKQTWMEMDEFMQSHCDMPPRKFVKQVFLRTLEQARRYPLIQTIDKENTEYLYRKLPKEIMEAHTHDDNEELLKLEKYGIRFKKDIPVVTKILQTLAISLLNLSNEDEAMQSVITDTILDGLINEIVVD